MNLENTLIGRPARHNVRYYGDLKTTLNGNEEASLYGVHGRAWVNEQLDGFPADTDDNGTRLDRWFFQPNATNADDSNIYIVYEASLRFL